MPKQLDNVQLAHLEGFVKQCQDMNIDPEELLKIIAEEKAKVSLKGQAKTVAGGALRGGATGAAIGGIAGVTIPMVLAALHMAKNPELAGSVKLQDVAKLIAAGGIVGATGGGSIGAGYGGISSAVDSGLPSGSRIGAALKGLGRGAVAGGAIGAVGGSVLPIAQLLALKARGGNISDVGGKNIAKAFGRSALTGATTGLLGGGMMGGAMGAATGKIASHSAVQRIWDKVSTNPNPVLNSPPTTTGLTPAPAKPGYNVYNSQPSGAAGVGLVAARNTARDSANTLGGGMGVSGGGMSRSASAEDSPQSVAQNATRTPVKGMIKKIDGTARASKYMFNGQDATKNSAVDKPEAVEPSKDISMASGKDSEEPASVGVAQKPTVSPTDTFIRMPVDNRKTRVKS